MRKVDRDLKGKRFGRWLVEDFIGMKQIGATKYRYWMCVCDCGNIRKVYERSLLDGLSQSCGCLRHEKMRSANTTHGQSQTSLYRSYQRIIARCYNPKDAQYHNYGGRGIKLCRHWRGKNGFVNFERDMGYRPSPVHSLERINNNKGYSPNNCLWANIDSQAVNKRNTFYVTYKNQKISLRLLCARMGIQKHKLVYDRIKYLGWSVESALEQV